MAIYMEFEGIPGDATAEGHPDWITINSVQFGVGRGIATPTGSGENREGSNCSFSEVVVTKVLDSASGGLFNQLLRGTAGKKVKIDFTATSQGGENVYLQYEFEEVIVSGLSYSSGGDRPSESLSLNFVRMQANNKEQDSTGTEATGGNVVTYDIALAKAG